MIFMKVIAQMLKPPFIIKWPEHLIKPYKNFNLNFNDYGIWATFIITRITYH